MKKHIVFLILMLLILTTAIFVVKDGFYILNEPLDTLLYKGFDISGDKVSLSNLDQDSRGAKYGVLTLKETTVDRLDFLKVFSSDEDSMYLESQNTYIAKVTENKVNTLISFDEKYGKIQELRVLDDGSIYAYVAKYDAYESWIIKESIIKFVDGQNPVEIFNIEYSGKRRPYLSGNLKDFVKYNNQLEFIVKDDDTISKYTYKSNLDKAYEFEGFKDVDLVNVAGNEGIGIFFLDQYSMLRRIDNKGNVSDIYNYLAKERIAKKIYLYDDKILIETTQVNGQNAVDEYSSVTGRVRMVASNSQETSNLLEGISDSYINPYIVLDSNLKLYRVIVLVSLILSILLTIYIVKYFYTYILQDKGVISFKLVVILVPIVIAIMFVAMLQTVISSVSQFNEEIKLGKYIQFQKLIEYQISYVSDARSESYLEEFINNIDLGKKIEDESYNEFYSLLTEEGVVGLRYNELYSNMTNSDYVKLYSENAINDMNFADFVDAVDNVNGVYMVVDVVKDDNLYKVLDTENNFKMFTKRDLSNESFKEAISGKVVNRIGQNDEYIFSMKPIFSSKSGEVIGIVQVGMKYASYRNSIDTLLFIETVKKIIYTSLILVGIITLITYWSLRKIGKLTRGVRAVSEGDMSVSIDIKSNDEIGELASVFNQMTMNLDEYIKSIMVLNESYYRFVPQETFNLLNKTEITEVNLGENNELEGVVFVAEIDEFYKLTRDMNNGDTFNMLNKHLGMMGAIVRNNGGIIEKYTDSGLVAIFNSKSDGSIVAAKEIQKNSNSHNFTSIKIVIGYSELLYGVIGEEKRVQVSLVSNEIYILNQISKKSDILSSNTILTHEAFTELSEYINHKYIRVLGKFSVGVSSEVKLIYDLFEFDSTNILDKKVETKEEFELSYNNFTEKEYLLSRGGYVRVLDHFIEDKISKLYFYESDKRYSNRESYEEDYISL
ncbi:MAG: HAMP domain-containing protein [Acidaminobacteraceae bacterium]